MNRTHTALSVASFLLLSACATTGGPPAPVATAPAAGSAAFRTSDFAWSTAAGRGGIQGQVNYTQQRTAFSCSAVVLTPETPWVRQRMNILYKSTRAAALPAAEVRQRTPPERSQDYSGFVRRANCDAANKFTFSNLPDGAWYVITVVKPKTGAATPEVAIMRRVETKAGQAVAVTL